MHQKLQEYQIILNHHIKSKFIFRRCKKLFGNQIILVHKIKFETAFKIGPFINHFPSILIIALISALTEAIQHSNIQLIKFLHDNTSIIIIVSARTSCLQPIHTHLLFPNSPNGGASRHYNSTTTTTT